MNESLISVVVPVYNAEHQIRCLLDSLLLQTWSHFEVLLINDGSTDESGVICEEYADKDHRFKVIHKKNEGVSAARQTGIEAASGVYVIHADADDWIESDMLQDLYAKAVSTNADVVFCDYYVESNGNSVYRKQEPPSFSPEMVLRAMFQRLHGSCWNKLVRRSCYSQYGCHFPKGINYCEDLLFWVQLLQHPKIKITYVDKAYYHYVMNETSITHNYTRKTYQVRCAFYNQLCNYLPSIGFEKELENARLSVFVEGYMHRALSNIEAWKLLWMYNKKAAFFNSKSIRWKVGYIALALGCFPVARKLLRF